MVPNTFSYTRTPMYPTLNMTEEPRCKVPPPRPQTGQPVSDQRDAELERVAVLSEN